jgi:hypothetical protein
VKKIKGLEEVKWWRNILDREISVIDEIQPIQVEGDRGDFVFAGGENPQETLASTNRGEGYIHSEYM